MPSPTTSAAAAAGLILLVSSACGDTGREADSLWTGGGVTSEGDGGDSDSSASGTSGGGATTSSSSDPGTSGTDGATTAEDGGIKLDVGPDTGAPPACDPDAEDCGCTAVDILFVIDNSGSMFSFQQIIGPVFAGFVDIMTIFKYVSFEGFLAIK